VTEFVKLEVEGGVGTIRLDRPPMNAISRQVQEELLVVAAEATQRADVRAVVLYGGEKVLAAGADVKEMANMTYADMSVVARRLSAGFGALASIP
jgi:enoyl-CoA hydratase/carnithine racemase